RPSSLLFPYTTLFRSDGHRRDRHEKPQARGRGGLCALCRRVPRVQGYADLPFRAAAAPGRKAMTARKSFARAYEKVRRGYGYTRSEEHTSELQSRFDL